MTSLSAAKPVAGGVAPAAPSKRGGVDYSKFDSIVDSDDEKPDKTSKDATTKTAAPEKPVCHNCMNDIEKPLRCGVCKKVSYCSQKCQKDDWSYHKRNCKKPEEPKPKASTEEKKAKKEASEDKKRRDADEKVVDEGEESPLSWYKHRDWKPTNEPKQEFKPVAINEADAAAANSTTSEHDGSVWNKAGTWEDKDVTSIAQSQLRERLREPTLPDINVAGGVISVEEVEQVEGDASKPVIRGKMRHIFDFSFKVKFSFKWMDSAGQQKAAGSLAVNDFTNDAFGDNDNAPVFEVSFKAPSIDAARRKAIEDVVGGKSWPAPAGTLVGALAARMKSWSDEFQEKKG